MIPITPFVIGFLTYVGFCILTFEMYSRNKEMTKAPALLFIYFYYTALAIYVINLVEMDSTFFIKLMQVLFYAIPCALLLINYYKTNIRPKDEELYGQNV